MPPFVESLATILSIAGFFLSVWVLIQASSIKKKLREYDTFKRFAGDKESIRAQLGSCVESLLKDQIRDRRIASEISNLIGQLEGYALILDRSDRRSVLRVHRILSKSPWSAEEVSEVTNLLSRLEGKLRSKEGYLGE